MGRSFYIILLVLLSCLPRFAAAQTTERCTRSVALPGPAGRAPMTVRIPCDARPLWEGGGRENPAPTAAVTPTGMPVRPPRIVGMPSSVPARPTTTTSTGAVTPAVVRPAPSFPTPRVAIPVPAPTRFAPRVVPGQPASGPWVTETRRYSPQPGVVPRTFAVLRPEPAPEEPTPAPTEPAITTLPDTSVRHVPVWFPGFAGFNQPVQAIVCVGRNAREARVDGMTPEQRAQFCREWSQDLPNGRAADIVLPRTQEWTSAVASLYARRGDEAEWHYENQQALVSYPNGVPLYASDLNAREQTHHLLYAPLPLPATRVASGTTRHGRRHAHGRRRAHR